MLFEDTRDQEEELLIQGPFHDSYYGRSTEQAHRKLIAVILLLGVLVVALLILLAVQLTEIERADVVYATCRMESVNARFNITGLIEFEESDTRYIRISGDVHGLQQNHQHGIHIREFGSASIVVDPASIGEIYNPHDDRHGCLSSDIRKVGDLGNVDGAALGIGHVDHINDLVRLTGKFSIIGRSLVVTEHKDDCMSESSGNSGLPIAACIIQITNRNISSS